MQWKISNAKGSGTDFLGYAEKTPLAVAVCELWRKFIEDAAPLNAGIGWDYLGVYIYIDSGRVILFPVVQASRFGGAKSTCQIICPDLLASYEHMIESDIPEDDFDAWATQTIEKVASLVSEVAKKSKLPERLERPEVRICFFAYGGDSGKSIKEDHIKGEANHPGQQMQ